MTDLPPPIRTALDADRATVRAGLSLAPADLRPLVEAALAPELPPNADVHGALAALLTFGARRVDLATVFAEHWITAHGLAFAIGAAVRQRELLARHPRNPRLPGGFDFGVRWVERRTDTQVVPALDVPTWDILHAATKRTKGAEREVVERETARLRDAPLPLVVWLDGIVPVPSRAVESVQRVVALPPGDERRALLAWAFRTLDALALAPGGVCTAAATALLDAVAGDPSILPLAAESTAALAKLLPDPSPTLVALLELARSSKFTEKRPLKKLAEALSRTGTSVATAYFASHVDSKLIGTIAAEHLRANATAAVSAVGAAPTVTKKTRERVVTNLAQSKPEELRAALDEAGDEIKKEVRTALRRNVGSREATEADLPWILRHPPWRRSRAQMPIEPIALAPAAFEERLHLEERDRDEADESPSLAALVRRGLAALPELLAGPIDDPKVVRSLRRIESPRVALAMTRALGDETTFAYADAWFARFPEAATIGLLPAALGATGRTQAEATAGLKVLVRHERRGALLRAAARFGPEGVAGARRWLEVAPLYDCPARAPRLPDWIRPALLPRILLANGALLTDATLVLEMMAFSEPSAPYRGLVDFARACDRRSLDAWLVALLEQWVAAEGPPSGRTFLAAAVAIADGEACTRIGRWIRDWGRRSQTRAWAIDAIDALGRGGALGLSTLADVAQKGVRGEVAAHADEILRDAARDRGLTEDDLADLVVPTFDLERGATTTLDFGPRTFTVRLDGMLDLVVFDGAVASSTLPRAKKTDDPVKARAAAAKFKALKKSVAAVARSSALRLELAMTSRRTWRPPHFADAIVRHPLLGAIARRLLWAAFEGDELRFAFRIAEDGTYADANDQPITIDDGLIRLIHPIDLPTAEATRFADVFADYEILPPFPQLGRTHFEPDARERERSSVLRWAGIEAPFMAICGRLEARGWRRDPAEEGMVPGYSKLFGDVRAHYAFADPIVFGAPMPTTTTVGTIHLRPWSAMAFSEAAYDLHVFQR